MVRYLSLLALMVCLCGILGGCKSDPAIETSKTHEAVASASGSNANSDDNSSVKIGSIRSAKPAVRRGSPDSKSATKPPSASAASEKTTQPTVLVFGRVTTADGAAVSSATLELIGFDKKKFSIGKFEPENLAQAHVDKNGSYELRAPVLDMMQLKIISDSPEMQFNLDRGKLYKNDKPLPGLTRLEQNIELLQGHKVSGQVLNEKGQPMTGVPVHARPQFKAGDRRMMKTSETTSTAAGAFELENLPSGEWVIGTSHPDYAAVVKQITVPTTGPVTLQLSARGGTITGHVVHKVTGAAAGGINMILRPMHQNAQPAIGTLDMPQAKSAADGSFRFEHVTPGSKALMLMPVKETKLALVPPGDMKLSVGEGETTDVTVYVYPGYTITGRVFDKDTGEALSGAKISGNHLKSENAAVSDSDGNFKLENVFSNLSSGKNRLLSLAVDLKGYAPETEGYNSTVQFALPDDALEVSHDIPMIKKLVVRGVVVTSTDKPIPHANVTLYNNRTHSQDPSKAAVNADGTFELETVPFVQAVVEATASGYGPVISDQIDVGVKDIEGIKIVMEPGGTVEGRVLDPKGEPVSGAKVSQQKDYGFMSTYVEAAVSGDKGIYLINDAPKSMKLKATAEGYADSEDLDLSLAAGETRTGVDLTLREGLNIAGRVLDANRKPVSGITVMVQGVTNIYKQANTDKDGKFKVTELPDGMYKVTAYGSPQKTIPAVKAGTIDLEIVLDAKVEREAANKLIGTVVDDATSQPIKNFEIQGYEDQITKLDEPGKFQMTGIRDRTAYGLAISSPGYDTQNFETKTGSGGETIEQEFRLGKGGVIIGRVVEKGTQKPMPGITVVNWGSAQYYERNNKGPKGHSITDEKGKFILAPAPTGMNLLDIKPQPPFSIKNVEAQVHSEETTDLGDIELNRGGTITGIVVQSPDDEPVPGKPVEAAGWSRNGNSQNRVEQNSTTDAEGKFKFEALPEMQFTIRTGQISKTVNLESEGTADVKLVLGGVTVSGKVLRGNAPVQASVSATGAEGLHISTYAQTGEYTIENVTPGTYNFSVYPQDNSGSYNPLEETVEIPDQAEFTKNFKLPDGRMEVSVIDAAGAPVDGADVTLTQKSSDSGFDQKWLARTKANKRTDSNGKVTFEGLDSGSFGVSARKEGAGTAMKPDVQVTDGAPAQVQLQLSNEGGTLVSVALSYTTGQGIPEAWCYLHGPNGPFTHSAKRGADGVMTIENIPPGTYTTNVSYWSHSQSEKTVEIKVNETARIEDVLYPAGAIHWTLTKADGSPAGGATVTVTPIQTNPPEEPRSGKAAANGNFVQRGLAAGTYQATAQLAGKPAVTETFTVAAGGNVEKTTTAPGW